MTSLARPSSTIGRVFEHRFMSYRRTFRASIFSSFLSPILFLTAMGIGLGTYVSDSAALGGVPYLVFLAPGLLAATAMQSASFEATFPIMAGLVWTRIFHGMYATPISPRDIALGNLAWIVARLALITTIFTVVIVAFGAAESPLIVLAIPAAILTGMAFAAPIAAFSATQKTPDRFSTIFRFGITPLFLFSGHVLPDQLAAGRAPGVRLADAAVPWGRADPRPVARDDRRRAGRGGHPRHLPDDLRRRRGVADDPDHRAPGWCSDDRAADRTRRSPSAAAARCG